MVGLIIRFKYIDPAIRIVGYGGFSLLSLYTNLLSVSVKLRRLVQVLLGLLLLAALIILVYAMIHGLRDMPDMHLLPSVLNTGLHADYVWFQDISMETWPRAWIISAPFGCIVA